MTEPSSSSAHAEIIQSILAQNPHLRPRDAEDVYESMASYRNRVLSALRLLPVVGKVVPAVNHKKELIEKLKLQQKTAVTYKQWYAISAELDELLGNNMWKLDPQLPFYDHDNVYKNMQELKNARMAKDHKLLLYLIRTKLTRNVGNMGDARLYRQSHVGTKKLIEEFIDECQQSLDYLVSDPEINLDDRYLLGMLIQTRKNIGRTALLLSGGSTFGVSHVGVLIALLEANLMPRIISGSSSGSIFASMLCCNTNEEMAALLALITEQKLNIFGKSDPTESTFKKFLERVSHMLKFGTFFDIKGLQETMREFVGDLTFREAYNRTGKILNITVSPASMHEQTRLLNYLSAPNCLIWSAVSASCSLPGIFPSSTIYEKNPRTGEIREWNNDVSLKYVDGSVDGDLPILRLSEMFNVDHIIAVQINPHVSPILRFSVGSFSGPLDNDLREAVRGILNNCYDFVTSEIIHYLQVIHEMDVSKNLAMKAISLLSQQYSGDVTILPDLHFTDFTKVFENPEPEFLLDFLLRGARACWPKISLINNHCGVEFALDKAITKLRGRVIASSNNRITYGSTAMNGTTSDMLKNGEMNSYLISYPVFNRSKRLENDHKQLPQIPQIKRHNTTTNASIYSTGERIPKQKKRDKFVSMFSGEKAKGILKGKSTTSLLSMNGRLDRGGASEPSSGLLGNNDNTLQGIEAYGYSMAANHDGRRIRKAVSSGNFQLNDDSLTHSPVKLRTSPKDEKSVHYSDYGELASLYGTPGRKQEKPKSLETRERANLPRSSGSGNLLGLTRLRESSFSYGSLATPNALVQREYDTEVLESMKTLNAPDLRRLLSKPRLLLSMRQRHHSRSLLGPAGNQAYFDRSPGMGSPNIPKSIPLFGKEVSDPDTSGPSKDVSEQGLSDNEPASDDVDGEINPVEPKGNADEDSEGEFYPCE